MPLLRKVFDKFLNDEMAVRRWGRAALGAFATGGLAFGEQLAQLVEAPGAVKLIKLAAVVAGFLALAVNLGEPNPKAPEQTE